MISDMFERMWMMIFPNSFIGALAILVFFAYFCFKKNLGIAETFIVIFPVLIGVSTTGCFGTTVAGCLPVWFAGSFIMGVGLLWGIALAKAINTAPPAFKFYGIVLCMNAALMIYGYHLAEYQYATSGATVDLLQQPAQVIVNQSLSDAMASPSTVYTPYSLLWDFLFGGGISGFFLVSGIPYAEYWALPLQAIGILLLLPILIDIANMVINFMRSILSLVRL